METAIRIDQVLLPSFAIRHWREGSLPTPHLLDATWWFADETVSILTTEIKRTSGLAVCLGTPSVALRAWQEGLDNVLLIDSDPLLKRCLARKGYANVMTANLKRVCPLISKVDLAIADPPWYEAETRSFLEAAHASAQVGATILISLPPFEVRDSIREERARLIKHATAAGLELIQIEPGKTRYIRPPFEHNVNRACGDQITADWRTGDLATFRVLRPALSSLGVIEPENVWDEVCFAHTRLRVLRTAKQRGTSPRLQQMGWPDDVFPSCSRRHPSRDDVEVWTSGNRAFLCEDTRRFLEIARMLEANTLVALRVKVDCILNCGEPEAGQAAKQILDLVQREETDYEAIQHLYV